MSQPNDLLRTVRMNTPSRALPSEPLSRRELAEAANAWLWQTTNKRYELDAHTIARYERGAVRWPGRHYRAALRHVLGVATDADLGFRPTPSAKVVRSKSELTTPDFNSGIDFGASPSDFLARLVVETPTPIRIGRTDVEQVRATTRALATSENLFGGGLSCEAAAGQLRWAARLLEARADSGTRREMFEAVGNLAGVVAFSAFDIGDQKSAARCFRFALWCSEEGGSWALRAATLADMARQAVYVGDLDEALSLIEFAQVRADRLSATGRAMVSTVRARLLAMLGRHAEAVAEVDRADSHFVDHNPADDPPWLIYYDDAEHQGGTARALIPLAVATGEPGQAGERLAAAIRLHSDSYPRSRAFSRTRLATLTMTTSDPRDAVALGQRALAEAVTLHSRRMTDELRALDRACRRHSALAEVTELRHNLAVALGAN